MAFDLQDDMDNIFLNSGFEESVTYYKNNTGPGLVMDAVVMREGYIESPKLQNTENRKYKVSILVSTNGELGIDQVTTNEDSFTFLQKIGDTVVKRLIVKGIVYDDEGAFMLGLG